MVNISDCRLLVLYTLRTKISLLRLLLAYIGTIKVFLNVCILLCKTCQQLLVTV